MMYPLWRSRSEPEVGRGGGSSEAEAEPWGRARRRSPPEAEVEAEPWGRARRSFLLRPRLNLTVVGFARVVGIAAGAGQAALFFCQIGQ
jgi:hypothetical protein